MTVPTDPQAAPSAATPVPARQPVGEGDATSTPRAPRVLLVEDVAVNQLIANKMLQSIGCSVEIAANGVIAVTRTAEERFDLVLMDCHMPEMDGFEATRRIRSREAEAPGTPRLPIVALTASALADERAACLTAGMDDFATKPLKRDELQRVVHTWVAGLGNPA